MEQIVNKDLLAAEDTSKVLKKLNQVYGIGGYKETIVKYAKYLSLKKEGLINIGNPNVLVSMETEEAEVQKLIDVIYNLLKINNIISTKYKRVSVRDVREVDYFLKLKEQFIIIEVDSSIYLDNIKKGIQKCIQNKKEKVFLLLDKNKSEDELPSLLFTWRIRLGELTAEEKESYIKQMLRKNHIKIDKKCTFVQELSMQSMPTIKEEVMDIILTYKANKVDVINAETLRNMDKKQYGKGKNKNLLELDDLIGLETVKKQIKQIINYIKVNKQRGEMPSLHMVFEGNPGTGKTEVSRIIGRIFAKEKILSNKGVFVEADRERLVGKYVGHTAAKTKAVIERANGGVLFIDEAYSLNPRGSDKDYGYECIATLMKEMEDNRDNLCVILAGYDKEMEELLKVNSGFQSRIAFKIKFPDYTEEELYQIFQKMAVKQHYKLTDEAKPILLEYFEKEKQKENFANARCVRNLFEKVKFAQTDRIITDEKLDRDKIEKCDIQDVIDRLSLEEKQKPEKRKIGFAS